MDSKLKKAKYLPLRMSLQNERKTMETGGLAQLATALAQQRTMQDVSVAVLKKTLQIEAGTATSLLAALPPVEAANLPLHLGQTINTSA